MSRSSYGNTQHKKNMSVFLRSQHDMHSVSSTPLFPEGLSSPEANTDKILSTPASLIAGTRNTTQIHRFNSIMRLPYSKAIEKNTFRQDGEINFKQQGWKFSNLHRIRPRDYRTQLSKPAIKKHNQTTRYVPNKDTNNEARSNILRNIPVPNKNYEHNSLILEGQQFSLRNPTMISFNGVRKMNNIDVSQYSDFQSITFNNIATNSPALLEHNDIKVQSISDTESVLSRYSQRLNDQRSVTGTGNNGTNKILSIDNSVSLFTPKRRNTADELTREDTFLKLSKESLYSNKLNGRLLPESNLIMEGISERGVRASQHAKNPAGRRSLRNSIDAHRDQRDKANPLSYSASFIQEKHATKYQSQEMLSNKQREMLWNKYVRYTMEPSRMRKRDFREPNYSNLAARSIEKLKNISLDVTKEGDRENYHQRLLNKMITVKSDNHEDKLNRKIISNPLESLDKRILSDAAENAVVNRFVADRSDDNLQLRVDISNTNDNTGLTLATDQCCHHDSHQLPDSQRESIYYPEYSQLLQSKSETNKYKFPATDFSVHEIITDSTTNLKSNNRELAGQSLGNKFNLETLIKKHRLRPFDPLEIGEGRWVNEVWEPNTILPVTQPFYFTTPPRSVLLLLKFSNLKLKY